MTRVHQLTLAVLAVVLGCALTAARAQEAPAPASVPAGAPAARALPKPEELEPAVDTTHSAPATAPAGTNSAPGGTGTAAASPPAPARTAVPRPAPAATAAKGGSRKGPDTLQLDATEITGNRELPKVLYIVPWKRSDLGDLAGKPVNSLLDEVLQPLDRDVFRRENRYYDALQPGRAAPKTDSVQGSGDKP